MFRRRGRVARAAPLAASAELAQVLPVARESGDSALLLRALARAAVYMPLPRELAADEPGPRLISGDDAARLPLPVIELDGDTYVSVFSSYERMAHSSPADFSSREHEPVWRQGLLAGLLEAWPAGAGLAVDQASVDGLLLAPDAVERIRLIAAGANVAEAFELGAATPFQTGTPIDPPAALGGDALAQVAQGLPDVAELRLLVVEMLEPGGRSWPVIGILLDEPDVPEGDAAGATRTATMKRLTAAVESATDAFVALLVLPQTGGSTLAADLREAGMLLYRRGTPDRQG